jgi:hypothetical protein
LGTTRLRILGLLALGSGLLAVWSLIVGLAVDALSSFFVSLWVFLWFVGVGLGAAIRHQRRARLAE